MRLCAAHRRLLVRSPRRHANVDGNDNVVFARGSVSFIHTFLVGELIRLREEGRSRVERKHVSIEWAGVAARKPNLLSYGARILQFAAPWNAPRFRKKKRREIGDPRAALLFLLSSPFYFSFYRKGGKRPSASFDPFYTSVDRTISRGGGDSTASL